MAIDRMNFPDEVLYRLQNVIMDMAYREHVSRDRVNQLVRAINGSKGIPGFFKMNDRGREPFRQRTRQLGHLTVLRQLPAGAAVWAACSGTGCGRGPVECGEVAGGVG